MPDLTASLSDFARTLRGQGMTVGPGETAEALRAMTVLNTLDPLQMQDALRMVFTAHHHERAAFDAAFRDHFLMRGEADQDLQPLGVEKPAAPDQRPPQDERPGSPEERPGGEEGEGRQTRRTRQEQGSGGDDQQGEGQTLRSQVSPNAARQEAGERYEGELEDLLKAASALIRRVRLGRGRRWHPMPRGRRFDFRGTRAARRAS